MRRESFLLPPLRAPLLPRSILVYSTRSLAQAEQRRIELDSPPPIRVRAHRLARCHPLGNGDPPSTSLHVFGSLERRSGSIILSFHLCLNSRDNFYLRSQSSAQSATLQLAILIAGC